MPGWAGRRQERRPAGQLGLFDRVPAPAAQLTLPQPPAPHAHYTGHGWQPCTDCTTPETCKADRLCNVFGY